MARYQGARKNKEYALSVREAKFVSFYMESGDIGKAVKEAGFNTTSPVTYGKKLLAKEKIQKELKAQLDMLKYEKVASADEIMNFLTSAMRGEIKDQFGLEATLKDRMDAAKELAKRQIDMKAIADKAVDHEYKFTLVWGDSSNGEKADTSDKG